MLHQQQSPLHYDWAGERARDFRLGLGQERAVVGVRAETACLQSTSIQLLAHLSKDADDKHIDDEGKDKHDDVLQPHVG